MLKVSPNKKATMYLGTLVTDYFQVRGGGENTHIDGNFTIQYASKRSTSQYAGSDGSRTSGASCHIFVKNSAARYGYNAEI